MAFINSTTPAPQSVTVGLTVISVVCVLVWWFISRR